MTRMKISTFMDLVEINEKAMRCFVDPRIHCISLWLFKNYVTVAWRILSYEWIDWLINNTDYAIISGNTAHW